MFGMSGMGGKQIRRAVGCSMGSLARLAGGGTLCLAMLCGCTPPIEGVILNDMDAPAFIETRGGDAKGRCKHNWGTLAVGNKLLLSCDFTSITYFSYKLEGKAKCRVDLSKIKSAIAFFKSGPFSEKIPEVALSRLVCVVGEDEEEVPTSIDNNPKMR
jgi:hypothetical protein